MQVVAGATQKVANCGEEKACHCSSHVDIERPAVYWPHNRPVDDSVHPLLQFAHNVLQGPQMYVTLQPRGVEAASDGLLQSL